MRLVCAGVANGISHTTSGEPTSSTVVLDRVTGQPIALFGVGGGVVRSMMALFGGDLQRFPPCVVVLSPSAMTFVDLPVYLRLMTLQNVRVTVMAPSSVLDTVVQYIEDVLAEESAHVGLAVQRMTHFVDLDTSVPVVLPTKTSLDASSSSTAAAAKMHGGRLNDVQSAFDDVIFSQWILFLHSTKSEVREDHCLFNCVLVHRRVVLDGASKHKEAAAAALGTALSAASMLASADNVVKEDTTTMLAVLGHVPQDPAAITFVQRCDAVVSSVLDEGLIRRSLAVQYPPSRAARTSTSNSASTTPRPSNLSPPPGAQDHLDEDEDANDNGRVKNVDPPVMNPPLATTPLILNRFAAHEPPLTFDPRTFVAQRGMEYRITPGEGITELGSLLLAHRGKEKRGSPAKPIYTTSAHHSPLGAKLVEEDLEDTEDDDAVDALQRDEASANRLRLSGVDAGMIGSLRRQQQQYAATRDQLNALPSSSSKSDAPYDPEKCAFASSLRAEHYDAEMSQLTEMRRQLGVPSGVETNVQSNWGSAADGLGRSPRSIGRHTAARSHARGAEPATSVVALSPGRLPVKRDGKQGGPVLLRPNPTRHFNCVLYVDSIASSSVRPFPCVLRQRGDPLDCPSLNVSGACQERLRTVHEFLSAEQHGSSWERVRTDCVQLLCGLQFGTEMLRVSKAMCLDGLLDAGELQDAITGSWEQQLQDVLNEAMYVVLVALTKRDGSGEGDDHPMHATPRHRKGGNASPHKQHLTKERVEVDAPHEAHLALQRLHHVLRRLSERWLRWTTLQREPLNTFAPFGEPNDRTEYSILVSYA